MKERPILFSAPMVRALLDGRKTQTRRAVKGEPLRWLNEAGFTPGFVADPGNCLCPYGAPGDRLWVRETFSGPWGCETLRPRHWPEGEPIWFWADGNPEWGDWTRPRPSIHMPRWASRLTLRITEVRVQRLQTIADHDCLAEGVLETDFYEQAERKVSAGAPWSPERLAFADLWQSINGTWEVNPWVWAVSFERVKPPPDVSEVTDDDADATPYVITE